MSLADRSARRAHGGVGHSATLSTGRRWDVDGVVKVVEGDQQVAFYPATGVVRARRPSSSHTSTTRSACSC